MIFAHELSSDRLRASAADEILKNSNFQWLSTLHRDTQYICKMPRIGAFLMA